MATIYLSAADSKHLDAVRRLARETELHDPAWNGADISVEVDPDATWVDCDNAIAGAALMADVRNVVGGES